MKNDEILKLKTEDHGTIGEYLRDLLKKVWEEGEGFSGKRPFGNSGWEHDLIIPLVKVGLVKGSVDEYGYLEDYGDLDGSKKVLELIDYCFEGKV